MYNNSSHDGFDILSRKKRSGAWMAEGAAVSIWLGIRRYREKCLCLCLGLLSLEEGRVSLVGLGHWGGLYQDSKGYPRAVLEILLKEPVLFPQSLYLSYQNARVPSPSASSQYKSTKPS